MSDDEDRAMKLEMRMERPEGELSVFRWADEVAIALDNVVVFEIAPDTDPDLAEALARSFLPYEMPSEPIQCVRLHSPVWCAVVGMDNDGYITACGAHYSRHVSRSEPRAADCPHCIKKLAEG